VIDFLERSVIAVGCVALLILIVLLVVVLIVTVIEELKGVMVAESEQDPGAAATSSRSCMVSLRLTAEEAEMLRRDAKRQGLTLSALIRRRARSMVQSRRSETWPLLNEYGSYNWPLTRDWESFTSDEQAVLASRFLQLALKRDATDKGESLACRKSRELVRLAAVEETR